MNQGRGRAELWIELSWIAGLTIFLEGITYLLRFHLGMESTRDTRMLRLLTFGLRIHHGYPGVALLLAALLIPKGSQTRKWFFRLGVALVASDLIHHFLVLWPLTGDPHLDLTYPD